jgi:hypothetical protein
LAASTAGPTGHTASPPSRVLATIYHRDRPFDEAFADFFDRQVRPVLAEAGAVPLACLQTEHAENTFPARPAGAHGRERLRVVRAVPERGPPQRPPAPAGALGPLARSYRLFDWIHDVACGHRC